jgi:hypothetical protein
MYNHMQEQTKICSQCKLEKSTSDFPMYKKSGKPMPKCKRCVSNFTKQWQTKLSESNNPEDILESTFYKILQSSRSNAMSRNIPYELSLPVLRTLYTKQQGNCYYTNTPMTLRTKTHLDRDPLLISLDRLDSTQGYTPTNTVLCCWGINALKGYHPESTLYTTLKLFYNNAHAIGKC